MVYIIKLAVVAIVVGSSFCAQAGARNCSEKAILKTNKDYLAYSKAGGAFAMEAKYFAKTEAQKCQLAKVRDSVKKGTFKSIACPKKSQLSHVACFQSYLRKLPFLAYTETDTLDLIVLKVVNKDLQDGLVSWYVSDVQAVELRVFLLERLVGKKGLAKSFKGKNIKEKNHIKKMILNPDIIRKKQIARSLAKSITKDFAKLTKKTRAPATVQTEKQWANGVIRASRQRLKKVKKVLGLK